MREFDELSRRIFCILLCSLDLGSELIVNVLPQECKYNEIFKRLGEYGEAQLNLGTESQATSAVLELKS